MATPVLHNGASQTSHQSRQNSISNHTTPWSSSINPAIFIPIQSFSNEPILDQEATISEKLQQLVNNLRLQHETVKSNMLIVAHQRAKELRAAAQAELDELGDVKEPPPDPAKEQLRRKQMDEIVKNLRARPPEGLNAADLQVKPPLPGARSTLRSNEDVVMGGTQQRTPAFIRAEIVLKLERLVDDTIEEIAEYEEKARRHVAIYQGKLEVARRDESYPGFGNLPPVNSSTGHPGLKRTVSFSKIHSPSVNSPGIGPYGQPTKGILRSTVNSPVDEEAMRRMNIDLSEEDADRYYVNGGFNASGLSMDAERKRAEVLRRQDFERAEERRQQEARDLEEMSRNAQAMRKGR